MRVVIIGCGRVGAGLASGLAGGGDAVAVIDKDPKAFERLGEDFTGLTWRASASTVTCSSGPASPGPTPWSP